MAINPNLSSSPPKGTSDNMVKDVLLPASIILVVIFAGIATGWKVSNFSGIGRKPIAATGETSTNKGEEVGSKDTQTFKDEADGLLEEGGIDGEGTHHLVRDGGPSKNVYLTSSVVDLDEFVGEKVHVWGETFDGEKAGWLMDVGRIKIAE